MFWLSVVLAVLIGGFALFNITVGVGLQIIAVVLAANAYARLKRGKPQPSRATRTAVWIAFAVSGAGLVAGLYQLLA